jgi:hypothetical protein
MFVIDLNKFVDNFVPPFLRKPRMLAWAKLQVYHVGLLWVDLSNQHAAWLNELAVNIATDTLQAHLRTLYPLSAGNNVSIVTNSDAVPYIYIGWPKQHHKPVYGAYKSEAVAPKYYPAVGFPNERRFLNNYTVKVPIAYQPQEPAILNILNKYKPVAKTFTIQYI